MAGAKDLFMRLKQKTLSAVLPLLIYRKEDTMIDLPVISNKSGNESGRSPEIPLSFNSPRRKSRKVMIGNVPVGGGSPISVQTMTKSKTSDIDATVKQIVDAAEAGCDIVRVTVNDKEAAAAIGEIVKQSPVPVVADIHFNHVFALKALEGGVAKVRLNPGNIGSVERIRQVLSLAKERKVPIRIGVNSGSLEKDILENTDIRPRRRCTKAR